MYLTESSSPLVPGARPSNSSDARTLICASKPSGVIASNAGSKRKANSSTAKSVVALAKRIATNEGAIFTPYRDVVVAFVSNAELTKGFDRRSPQRAPLQVHLFVCWS